MKNEDRHPEHFAEELNTKLLQQFPSHRHAISVETARRWMHLLGFSLITASKGYYTDDHNREDVVNYRDNIFLPEMAAYQQRMIKYSGILMDLDQIPQTVKPAILITHDESVVYCKDGKRKMWVENGKKILLPKSFGLSIMVSGFTCECHGFMTKTYGDCTKKPYLLFEAGTNREGWFTNDDLIQQLRDTKILFHDLHPGSDLLFAFDNSCSHHKRAPDGLDASLLPLKDGGKNAPKMRQTTFFKDGLECSQMMRTQEGLQKGLRSILSERNLWRAGMPLHCKACEKNVPHHQRVGNGFDNYASTTQCCARYCCSQQPDFLNQREWLREVVEDELNSNIIFYPKFHCELNYIEMVWCYMKSYLRRHCTYQFAALKEKLSHLEDMIPIQFVRRAARHCYRFMECYRYGLEGPLDDYAMKKYASHRSIPDQAEEVKRLFEKIKKNL